MNRRNRILAGMLAVQLVIAAVVFVPRVLPSPSTAVPLLGTLPAADVTGLTVQEQGGKQITLAKKSGVWVLPAADDFSASPDKVTAFLEKLIGLKTDPLVTRTANSHARLQVSDTTYVRKVDLTLADGSVKTLYLGSASGGATHVRVSGQDDVYLARGLNSFEASTDAVAWIDAAYVSVPQDKILSVTLENAQGKFEFTKDTQDNWVLAGLTADQKFNPDSAVTLLARLSSITMAKPLGKTAKPEYGLDKPAATVTVILSDTASTKVMTLKIGTKDADGNYPVISSDSTYYVSVAGFNVDGYVTAKLDTFLAAATPTPVATPTLEPVATPTLTPTEPLTSTSPVTTTAPVSATVPITPTAAP